MIKYENINIKIDDKLLMKGNMYFYEGCVNVITGNSGCGKTTLLHKISKLDSKPEGDLLFDQSYNLNKSGFIFQDCNYPELLKVKECMALYLELSEYKNVYSIDECLDIVDLKDKKESFIKDLSGGERQRLMIANCIYRNVDYLFMDEPTAYLDNKNTKNVIELILDITHRFNITTIIVSHDARLKEIADRLYLIENKEIKLIKDQKYIQKKIIKETSKKEPLIYYIKTVFKRSFEKNRSIKTFLMICVLTISLFVGFIGYLYKIENSKSNSLSHNELQLSYENQTFDDRTLDALKLVSGVDGIYPFYEYTTTINGNTVLIQSYYSNERLDNYTEEYIDTDSVFTYKNKKYNNGGYIYFSNSLSSFCEGQQILDIQFNNTNINISLNCNALLSKQYQNQYNDHGENIIYVPIDFIDQLYSALNGNVNKSNTEIYLLNYKSSKDLNDIVNTIKEIDKNIEIHSNIQLNNLIMVSKNLYHIKISTLILLISIIVVFGIYRLLTNYLYKIKSMMILFANGLSKIKTLFTTLAIELIQDIIFIMIAIILSIFIDIILGFSGYQLIIYQILTIISIYFIIYMITFIIELIYFKKHDVKTILRE